MINDAIHAGRIERGEEGLYQNASAQIAPPQNDIDEDL